MCLDRDSVISDVRCKAPIPLTALLTRAVLKDEIVTFRAYKSLAILPRGFRRTLGAVSRLGRVQTSRGLSS